jgi:lactate dehydrogenase-like 2-hydroxyacid dehydrogenase
MKVIAYSVKPFEKELMAKANQKKHDITLIFNSLDNDTVRYAEGKQAVIIGSTDDLSAEAIIEKLANLGVKYIAARSAITNHIDKNAAARYGIKLGNIPPYCGPQEIAVQIINNLDKWEIKKSPGKNSDCAKGCKR